MQQLAPQSPAGATAPKHLWWRWRGYAVRWLLFCEIVQLFQSVPDGAHYWSDKAAQALLGLAFGATCALVFTPAENRFNAQRSPARTWLLVVATWVAVKVVFVSVLALL